jgi:hypothetical protein
MSTASQMREVTLNASGTRNSWCCGAFSISRNEGSAIKVRRLDQVAEQGTMKGKSFVKGRSEVSIIKDFSAKARSKAALTALMICAADHFSGCSRRLAVKNDPSFSTTAFMKRKKTNVLAAAIFGLAPSASDTGFAAKGRN